MVTHRQNRLFGLYEHADYRIQVHGLITAVYWHNPSLRRDFLDDLHDDSLAQVDSGSPDIIQDLEPANLPSLRMLTTNGCRQLTLPYRRERQIGAQVAIESHS